MSAAVLSAGVVSASAAEAQGEVVFRDCPKCSMQIRISDDAKTVRVEVPATNGTFSEVSAEFDFAPGVHAVRVSNGEGWAPVCQIEKTLCR